MSLDAINWAGRQMIGRATGKAVLVALAHFANGKALAWPSVAQLVEFCEIHRKGILRELARLKWSRLIEDTGERRGRTGRVKVWRLATEQEALALSRKNKRAKSPRVGTISELSNGPPMRDRSSRQKAGPEARKRSLSLEMIPLGARNGPQAKGHGTTKELALANANGGEAADPLKTLFDLGVELLTQCGSTEKDARSLLGKWRKGRSDGEVLTALVDCRARAISNPVEWLSARLRTARFVSESGYEYRGSLEQIRREADKRRDMPTYWGVQIEIDREAKAKEQRQ